MYKVRYGAKKRDPFDQALGIDQRIFLYYPGRRQVLPKPRAFIDHMKSRSNVANKTRIHVDVEPDMGAHIRLSDKTSGVRSRKAMSRRLQLDEPQGLVEVLVRKACSPCAANLMLRA